MSLHSIWKLNFKLLASDKLKVTTSSDCETQALLKSRTRPTTAVQPNVWYRRRGIRSRGAILVLIISVCVNSGALDQLLQSLLKVNKLLQNSQALLFFIYVVFGVALPQLFYPLAGWLADARFGRHRVIQTSLWCVWLGQCALSVAILLFQLLQGHSTAYYCIFVYGLFPVAFIIINVGLAGFQANIIQFGIDQMVDASGDQISAFIHWYYWSTFIGGAAFSVVLQSLIPNYTLYVLKLGINVILTSVALLCWYKLKRWLIIEPQCQNPFKTAYDVITFASKHNRPIYRSALTYWDDTPPSRLDLGKNKYGGPFSTEEVENVKSFFAITAVLLSLGLYITADNTVRVDIYCMHTYMLCRSYSFSLQHH